MGCFRVCFRPSPVLKCRKRTHSIRHGSQVNPRSDNVHSSHVDCVSSRKSSDSDVATLENQEDQTANPLRKRVTFNSNVKTHEPLSSHESTDLSSDISFSGDVHRNSDSPNQSSAVFESPVMWDPQSSAPNHRYQNCRESEDELDLKELNYNEEDEDNDDENFEDYNKDGYAQEDGLALVDTGRDDVDKNVYLQTVLKPIEKLSQWRALKAKTSALDTEKENPGLDEEEPEISSDTGSKAHESSRSSGEDYSEVKNFCHENGVDASLSSWLASAPEATTTLPLTRLQVESSPPKGFEDRPILGMLTMEQLKQMARTSPKRSQSHSPDEKPIIGTVGTFWSCRDSNNTMAWK